MAPRIEQGVHGALTGRTGELAPAGAGGVRARVPCARISEMGPPSPYLCENFKNLG